MANLLDLGELVSTFGSWQLGLVDLVYLVAKVLQMVLIAWVLASCRLGHF